MQDDIQNRVAKNESLFREVNEAIERGQWPGELSKIVRFRCECASLTCSAAVELSLGEYEEVRKHPRQFILLAGHELPEVEAVVDSADGYVIVEKFDTAGEVAAATDPRS